MIGTRRVGSRPLLPFNQPNGMTQILMATTRTNGDECRAFLTLILVLAVLCLPVSPTRVNRTQTSAPSSPGNSSTLRVFERRPPALLRNRVLEARSPTSVSTKISGMSSTHQPLCDGGQPPLRSAQAGTDTASRWASGIGNYSGRAHSPCAEPPFVEPFRITRRLLANTRGLCWSWALATSVGESSESFAKWHPELGANSTARGRTGSGGRVTSGDPRGP